MKWVKQYVGVRGGRLPLAVALSVASPSFALDVEQCSHAYEIMVPHEAVGAYEDLGASTVFFQVDACLPDSGCSRILRMVHCRSGESVSLYIGMDQEGHDQAYSDARADDLKMYAKSKRTYTFSEATADLKAKGLRVRLENSDEEICACKALYPADRFGKTPYVFQRNYVEPKQTQKPGKDR